MINYQDMNLADCVRIQVPWRQKTEWHKKIRKDYGIGDIHCVRIEGDELYILGNKFPGLTSFLYEDYIDLIINKTNGEILQDNSFRTNGLGGDAPGPLTQMINFLIKLFYRSERKEEEFNKKAELYKSKNMSELTEKIKDINVYDLSKRDAEDELGPLKLVETGEPIKFIKAENEFWLRAEAYLLGTDAVVNYQPGSSTGTPVKFVKE